jgi:HEPN domain-containing protein
MPQHDRLDLARVLLARAIDDETLVRKVSADTEVADAIVGFHAQQAAEKLIKAVLAARGVAFIKSHALSYLVGLVEEHHIDAPPELSEADVLSPWAVEFRYEGEEPPAFDRPAALALVEKRFRAQSETAPPRPP